MRFRLPPATCVALTVSCLLGSGLPVTGSQDGAQQPPPAQPAPTQPPADPPPPAQPPGQPAASLRPRMREHFALGAQIRDAIIRADLEGVRAPAKELAALPQGDLPPNANTNVGQMQRLATEIAGAKDLPHAANGVAKLAAACGECHLAADVTPTLMAKRPRGEDETLAGKMRQHFRAADLLYRGLIVPNEYSWEAGAGVLSNNPVDLGLKPGTTPTPEVEALSKQLRSLAQEAVKAVDQKTRTDVYGRMLSTCSSCHREQGIEIRQSGKGD